MKIRLLDILIVSIVLALVACGAPGDSGGPNSSGGSDSSASPAGAGPSVAGGGVGGTGTGASIGGTGTGVITGFADVTINESRNFEVNSDTVILLDGNPVDQAQLQGAGLGLVARVMAAADVDADFTSGTAVSIEALHLVVGPVTGTGPLRVLRQTVVATGDTLLPGGLNPESLLEGDLVRVSGYRSDSGVIQATRLERAPGDVVTWLLTGAVSGVDENGFFIGSQQVSLGGITPSGCGDGLGEGSLVRVSAAPDIDFLAGSNATFLYEGNSFANASPPLDTVTGVDCLPADLQISGPAVAGELPAQADGLVTAVDLPEFFIQGQQIAVMPDTIWLGGWEEDVTVNARIEAQGLLDTNSGVLKAGIVTFPDHRVRIEAPLTENGDGLFQVLGMTVRATPLTDDGDRILTGGRSNLQVDVRGFVDSHGQIFATMISGKGKPGNGRVRLRGQVSSALAPPGFRMLGLDVDTTGMILLNGSGVTISASHFFRLISRSAHVEVTNGVYDGAHTIANSDEETTVIRVAP